MARSSRPDRGGRVLAVDATGTLTAALETALRDSRRKIVRAKSYLEAWMLLHQRRFDAVVVDDTIDSGAWRDLAGEIRSMQLTAPVIVTSPVADERMCVDALFSGAYDVLATPLNEAELRRVVQLATGERRKDKQIWRLAPHRHRIRQSLAC